jgi:hypothetical protein
MCTFITLIAATEDEDAINAVLSRFDSRTHKRRAERADTPCVTAALNASEREYLLVGGGSCDCGTYLCHMAEATRDPDTEAAAEIARYRRKGWPEAKITRAMQDRTRAVQRQPKRQPNEDAAYWAEILMALCDGLALRRLG